MVSFHGKNTALPDSKTRCFLSLSGVPRRRKKGNCDASSPKDSSYLQLSISVGVFTGQFAVSSAGDLAYIASPLLPLGESRLVTVDRTGRVEPLPAPTRSYNNLSLSPDARQVAVTVGTMTERTTEQRIWTYELTRQTLTPLTAPGSEYSSPRWTPDGLRIAFTSRESGTRALAWQRADGSAPPETLAREDAIPSSWSPDGRELAVCKGDGVWVLDVTVAPPKLRPVVQSPDGAGWPAFSPDGRWLLYASGPGHGRDSEVFLQPYPGPGPRLQVSVDGGANPAWNPNGREIFFFAPGGTWGRMMSVAVTLGAAATLGTPRQVFDVAIPIGNCTPVNCYSVAPDGQRFFAIQAVKAEPRPPVTQINLVQNWLAEVEAKVPSGM